jgi:hypothetical protein
VAGEGAPGLDRRHVDDGAASTLSNHLPGRGLRAEEDAREVRRHDLVPLGGCHLEDACEGIDPGIVHERVHAPEVAHRRGHERLRVLRPREVRLRRNGAPSADLRDERLGSRRRLAVVDDYLGPCFGEAAGHSLPQAASRAGDDHDPVG